MGTYILIILLNAHSNQQAMSMQEFSSQPACEAAKQLVIQGYTHPASNPGEYYANTKADIAACVKK